MNLLSTNMTQVKITCFHMMSCSQNTSTTKVWYQNTSGFVYKVFMKYTWSLCSDLCSIPKLSHYVWNILVPMISSKGSQHVQQKYDKTLKSFCFTFWMYLCYYHLGLGLNHCFIFVREAILPLTVGTSQIIIFQPSKIENMVFSILNKCVCNFSVQIKFK